MFIGLVLELLFFYGSLAIKCISMNNQPCLVRVTLIDVNLDELHYYLFVISMNRCDGSCSTVEDPFGGICVPNRMEDVNLKLFNMIKGINRSKTLAKHISHASVNVNLIIGNVIRDKNGTRVIVNVSVKNKLNIAHVKKIMPGIQVHMLASMIRIGTSANT